MGSKLERIRELKKQKEILDNVQANPLVQDFPPIAQSTVTVPEKVANAIVPGLVIPPKKKKKPKPPKTESKGPTLPPQQPKKKKIKSIIINNRLPDKSVFNVTYSEKTETWKGWLTIPGCPPFEATKGGVFRLLTTLDKIFRAWEREQQKPIDSELEKVII